MPSALSPPPPLPVSLSLQAGALYMRPGAAWTTTDCYFPSSEGRGGGGCSTGRGLAAGAVWAGA